ncbi:efflux RND transporter periplasmic adaptor subunit [Hyphococcus sp.]|jgi:RND family efflux transporter MFP subunit|uniref:efflux RND transporter periplasmic adaptor subunit n=1 Tax=Hyphococcus sp. TaxID=2038636 RepID=UPI003D0EAAF1
MKLPGSLAAGAVVGLVIGAATTALVLTARQPGGEQTASAVQNGSGGGRGGYAPAVTIVAAEAASVGKTLDVIGEGRALKSVALTSEATGIVAEVNIAPGKQVSQGDVLLRLDNEEQRIALERAKAQYPIAKQNAERYQDLLNTEAASELEAEAAFNNYKTIEADLRAAQFAIEQRAIRAPFDGVIGLTEIEKGDYVRAGDVVTTLDDTSSIVIEFAIPQEAARSVEIGQDVTARLASGAGAPQEGVVSAIDSRVDPATRTLKIEATFENENGALLPGAIFAVSTTSRGEPALSVPGLAIQWDRSGPFVWTRNAEGAATAAPVTILQRTDDVVLVSSRDLEPGDLVVWEGADRVREGTPLPGLTTQHSQPSSAGAANSSGPGAAGGSE